ncbi:ABC-2 family transporter protein [Bifidobacterium margollesii]|uniref:ABC-2 family transporter protein n=1 Tax=Bifidobacterium margollesii TaxID=2020964 RepID=A0A2N5JCB1_9BIFI|nr:ABC-2 transporter permease [Bifidobacterium margollesii]PLS31857.1 ABC-2 family transporter protein [Bifidobacterium margollesii]
MKASSSTAETLRRYCLPVGVIVAISCLMALMFYPMMNAGLRELPVAILSLDKGATVQGKAMNVGDTMVEKLTGAASDDAGSGDDDADTDESPMDWHEVKTQDELDRGLADHEYYAAITIPEDFTERQVAKQQTAMKQKISESTALAQVMVKAQTEAQQTAMAQAQAQGLTGTAAQGFVQQYVQKAVQGAVQKAAAQSAQTAQSEQSEQSTRSEDADDAEAPTVTVTIDNGKSPLVANLLKQSLPTVLGKTGATVETKVINEGDTSNTKSNALPTATMMGTNMIIMPTFMMSMVVAIVCVVLGPKSYDDKAQRWKMLGVQLGMAAVYSLLVALGADCLHAMIGAGWLDWTMISFLWLAGFAVMTVMFGLLNIALPLGVLTGILTLGLGMTTGIFPYELLPDFWRNWVYGWVPQRFIGEGARAVLYNGDGWWNSATGPLWVMVGIGLVIVVIAGVLPLNRAKSQAGHSSR